VNITCIATDAVERNSLVNAVGAELAFYESSSVMEVEGRHFMRNYVRSPVFLFFVKGEGFNSMI